MAFALANALGALGLPGWLAPDQRHLALSADIAAARLHAAFERTEAHRVYLCPLDKADVLPQLKFGPNRIGRLTAAELEELIDASRLRRTFPNRAFDARRFSQFTWLVSRENESVDRKPAERAVPLLFEPTGQDWGAIQPRRSRFAFAVIDALFAMLLAPWEDWLTSPSEQWRPLRGALGVYD
ncbi:MAG: hypothetical protein JO081_21020 [Alphaproteobacteria bacterium]|nr:hypothetical protein [Alphaproteobacteria bacterium]